MVPYRSRLHALPKELFEHVSKAQGTFIHNHSHDPVCPIAHIYPFECGEGFWPVFVPQSFNEVFFRLAWLRKVVDLHPGLGAIAWTWLCFESVVVG